MAKILTSSLITDIRGGSGGTVFSRNKGGLYIKPLVVPVIKRTDAQADYRNSFAGLSQGYNELTEIQKAGWTQYGIDYPEIDVFGVSRAISGQNAYLRSNMVLERNNLTILSDAPADAAVVSFELVDVYPWKSIADNVYRVGMIFTNGTGPGADAMLSVFMTRKIIAGETLFDQDYKLATTVPPNAADEPVVYFDPTQFNLKDYDNVKIKIIPYKTSNGMPGIPQMYDAVYREV